MAAKKRGILIYDHYSFKDQDPCVDYLRGAMKDMKMSALDIQRSGSITPKASTINRWLDGRTRCPRHDTFCAAMGAMGYRQEWVNSARKRRSVAHG